MVSQLEFSPTSFINFANQATLRLVRNRDIINIAISYSGAIPDENTSPKGWNARMLCPASEKVVKWEGNFA